MATLLRDPCPHRLVTAPPAAARGLALIAATCLALAAAAPLRAQQAPATVIGLLLNKETRIPVEGARVAVLGTPLAVDTDSTGIFRLSGVTPGVRVIHVRAIGFAVGSWLVQLDEGQTIRYEFEMEPRTYALAEVVITGGNENDWRSEAAFELRRARSSGYFFTRFDIAGRRANSVGELLAGVPGVFTSCRGRNCQVSMTRTARPCSPEYFLDGHPATFATGPSFPINQIRGVEVYRSQFDVPAEFQRINLRCGVIAIWTVEPGERLDRPGTMIGQRDSTTQGPGGRDNRPVTPPPQPHRPPDP